MISQSVTTLGDMGAPTDEEFEKLEEKVAAVREDVADISTAVASVGYRRRDGLWRLIVPGFALCQRYVS